MKIYFSQKQKIHNSYHSIIKLNYVDISTLDDPVCDKCLTTSIQSYPRGFSPLESKRSHCFLF